MKKKYDVVIKQISENSFRMFFNSNKSKLFADKNFKERLDYNKQDKYIELTNNDHDILNNTLGILLSNNFKVVSI